MKTRTQAWNQGYKDGQQEAGKRRLPAGPLRDAYDDGYAKGKAAAYWHHETR